MAIYDINISWNRYIIFDSNMNLWNVIRKMIIIN
jgi:hypothetical protein